jgi:site-specific recombinase XerD
MSASAGGSVTARPSSEEDGPSNAIRDHRADPSRDQAWLADIRSRSTRYLFPSRVRTQPHLSTRQYARIVHSWIASAGLVSSAYRTHSMRRTKAAQIYKKTGNRRAVQLLLGHMKLESTVRYLGIEVDDALAIIEHASCKLR